MKNVFIAAAGCVALALVGCGGDYASEGLAAFEASKFHSAVEYLQVAVREKPNDARLLYPLGVSYLETKRFVEALHVFDLLAQDSEFGARASIQAVRTCLRRGNLPEAQSRLSKAASERPNDPALMEVQGDLRAEFAREARDQVDKLLESHLGPRGVSRARTRVDHLVSIHDDALESAWTVTWKQFADELQLTDEIRFRQVIMGARSARQESEEFYRRVLLVNPLSITALSELGRYAADAQDAKQAQLLLGRLIVTTEEQITDPDLRLRLEPARREATSRLAACLERTKNVPEAIKLLERVSPTFARPGLFDDRLCWLYYVNGDVQKLEKAAEVWIGRSPTVAWARFYKGYALLERGDVTASLPYLVSAQGGSPKTAPFCAYLGMAYARTKNYHQAGSMLEAAVELDPSNASAALELATVLKHLGESPRAREVLRKALTERFSHPHHKDHARVKEALRGLYLDGLPEINTLEQARDLRREDPENVFIGLRLAELESEHGFKDNAALLIAELQGEMPTLAEVWQMGARIAIESDQYTQALQQLKRVEALEPGAASTEWEKARAYIGLKRYSEAKAAAQNCLRRDADQVDAALVLLELEMKRGDTAAARAIGLELVEKFPNDSRILRGVAQANALAGHVEDAVKTLLAVEEKEPNSVEVLLDLGEALVRAGRRQESVVRFERVTALAEGNTEALTRAAQGLYDGGQYADAARLYERVLTGLERGDIRNRTLVGLMQARDHLGETLGVLDIIAELRRTGEPRMACNLAIERIVKAERWPEAAAVTDFGRQERLLEVSGLFAGVKAHLRTGNWNAALVDCEELVRVGKVKPEEVKEYEGRALLGVGKKGKGMAALQDALLSAPEGKRSDILRTMASYLLDIGDSDTALKTLQAMDTGSPPDPALRVLAARAALNLQDWKTASSLLIEALGVDPAVEHGATLLAALLVREDRIADAAEVLRRAGHQGLVFELLEGLAGRASPRGDSAATLIAHLSAQRWKEAASAASTLIDLPQTFRDRLSRMVQDLEQSGQDPKPMASALGRALLYVHANALETQAAEDLRAARGTYPQHADWIDLLLAWTHLRFGRPQIATQLTLEPLKNHSSDPLVVYVAATTALSTLGAPNALQIVDRCLGDRGALPEPLAHDLAVDLMAHHHLAEAESLLTRITRPSSETVMLRAQLAQRREKHDVAAQLVEALPQNLATQPQYAFMTAYQAARSQPGNKAAARTLGALIADSKALALIDPVLMAEAAVMAGLTSKAPELIRAALAASPYAAPPLGRLALFLKDRPELSSLRESLERAVSVVDPRGELRRLPLHERPSVAF